MAHLEVLPRTTVEKWQMPDPVAVGADTLALDALALMAEHGIRHLPVVDSGRRVVGVISHNDRRAAAQRRAVGELMSHAPETIESSEPLERAARRLAERHLGCLPVVDTQGRLVGIFTETDALRALVALISARGEVPRNALEALVAELRRERWRLRRQLEHQGNTRRERTGTRREQAQDAADGGALRSEEILEEPLAGLAVQRLAALDHALARAARGDLGICERCGGAIPPARLRALPGAFTCAPCSRRLEGSARGAPLSSDLPAPAVPGQRVHTPQGEGVLVRIAPFGSCGEGSVALSPELLRPVDPEPYD